MQTSHLAGHASLTQLEQHLPAVAMRHSVEVMLLCGYLLAIAPLALAHPLHRPLLADSSQLQTPHPPVNLSASGDGVDAPSDQPIQHPSHLHTDCHNVYDYSAVRGRPYTIAYNNDSFLINNCPLLLLSGSIHYPRSTPAMWPLLLASAKQAHLNMVDTYVFWNIHEPQPGVYDFQALTTFLQRAAEAGLYVNLRVGPYICAAVNNGGLPMWLRDIPGLKYRNAEGQFQFYMRRFVLRVMAEAEPHLARNGGPIILAQIENEYSIWSLRPPEELSRAYSDWCAALTVELASDIPWMMCVQDNTPRSVLRACNGFYCDSFLLEPQTLQRSATEPLMWTEAWTNTCSYHYGEPVPYRPVEDILYATLRWFARGGAHINYYMWHGGTNFGRLASGPFITNNYDWNALVDEYGEIRPLYYLKLQQLHYLLLQHTDDLLRCQRTPLADRLQQLVVECERITILINDETTSVTRTLQHGTIQVKYLMSGRSAQVVDTATGQLLYNTDMYSQPSIVTTADISAHIVVPDWLSVGHVTDIKQLAEPIGSAGQHVAANGCLEQLSLTKDKTDYMWYSTTIQLDANDLQLLTTGDSWTLTLSSAHDTTYIYLNSVYITTVQLIDQDTRITLPTDLVVTTTASTVELNLLNVVSGIYFSADQTYSRGVQDVVLLNDHNLTAALWRHTAGLQYEAAVSGSAAPNGHPWQTYVGDGRQPVASVASALTWFNLTVSLQAPMNPDKFTYVWRLDLQAMRRGWLWVNNHAVGRYDLTASAADDNRCKGDCLQYQPDACRHGCGRSSQRYYHVPAEWINDKADNYIVLLEEMSLSTDVRHVLLQRKVKAARHHYWTNQ